MATRNFSYTLAGMTQDGPSVLWGLSQVIHWVAADALIPVSALIPVCSTDMKEGRPSDRILLAKEGQGHVFCLNTWGTQTQAGLGILFSFLVVPKGVLSIIIFPTYPHSFGREPWGSSLTLKLKLPLKLRRFQIPQCLGQISIPLWALVSASGKGVIGLNYIYRRFSATFIFSGVNFHGLISQSYVYRNCVGNTSVKMETIRQLNICKSPHVRSIRITRPTMFI